MADVISEIYDGSQNTIQIPKRMEDLCQLLCSEEASADGAFECCRDFVLLKISFCEERTTKKPDDKLEAVNKFANQAGLGYGEALKSLQEGKFSCFNKLFLVRN